MAPPPASTPAPSARSQNGRAPWRPWLVLAIGISFFHLSWVVPNGEPAFWLPGLGLGIALLSWFGWRVLPLLGLDLLLARFFGQTHGTAWALFESSLYTFQIALSWWVYDRLARGSRWLEDPNSCFQFVLLIPGLIAAGCALAWRAAQLLVTEPTPDFWSSVLSVWLGHALGILAVLPVLWVYATPLLSRLRFVNVVLPSRFVGAIPWLLWTTGEAIELAGLTISSAVLASLLVVLHGAALPTHWSLSLGSLLLVVWAGMRQGLRGGLLVAAAGALLAVCLVSYHELTSGSFGPLQGNFVAQCGTALLVGSSASWVRVREARYRHVVSNVPLVLYSVSLPRAVRVPADEPGRAAPRPTAFGPMLSRDAVVTLASQAAREIFGCDAEELLGPYAHWLQRIASEDRELVVAALAQLCMQKGPVRCEYRLVTEVVATDPEKVRWVRDTLSPQYREDGLLEGWEGFVEDITEVRDLSQNFRRTMGMLQALVSNLPMGVFFVHGTEGTPLLVNTRARQLLGRREDLAAGLEHLSHTYRLHRPDGSLYPPDELPVAKALRLGTTCLANDIVVHRPDGRRIALISWAAPIRINEQDRPDAAVWVIEDLSTVQPGEAGRRDAETFLRTVVDCLGSGLLIQDAAGTVVDCNPAACTILGVEREKLLGRPLPAPDSKECESHARDGAVISITQPTTGAKRRVLMHSVHLPAGGPLDQHPKRARTVTSFIDVTEI